jgi:putative restriction endonuclease
MAGISGGEKEGADSIVISGGYEDDEDYGDEVIYTGHGGNDPRTGKQIADQELKEGNLALALSRNEGLPVRVVRGPDPRSPYAPAKGYRYDGLYFVESYWQEKGRSGFNVCRFHLFREPTTPVPPATREAPGGPEPRESVEVQRIVRTTAICRRVKEWYGYRCQVCRVVLTTAVGPYAEGAHIRPLGSPHDGPDHESNLLCLCPNHHVLFDQGAIVVEEDLSDRVTGAQVGKLLIDPRHTLHAEHLGYHRERFGRSQPS